MAAEAGAWIAALRASHDHLVGVVGRLQPNELAGPSYCRDWSIAQVLSHLGSGAEIHLANVEAALAGQQAPSRDSYQVIWDRWNAKTPAEMVADGIESEERYVRRFEGLSAAQLGALRMEFGDRMLDAVGILGMRLSESAAHTWDVEVVSDPSAAVLASSVDLLVDLLPARVGRLGRGERPASSPVDLAVETSAPARTAVLHIGEEVSMSDPDGAPVEGSLLSASEAFFRLVYGRLDPTHTPDSTKAEGSVSLDELRRLFPGF